MLLGKLFIMLFYFYSFVFINDKILMIESKFLFRLFNLNLFFLKVFIIIYV